MTKTDIVIIGAGAAGLMCGIEASKRGKNVHILEHANKAGKKILMSGGGYCNFTNTHVSAEHFISHNPHFCRSALSRYTPSDFIALMKKHQIPFHEKKLGQLFCVNKAKDIVSMLLNEAQQGQANISLNTHIQEIIADTQKPQRFIIKTDQQNFSCQSVVIATGGLSIPSMGATGLGYNIAKQFNIATHPTRAGLVPFTLQPHDKTRYESLIGSSIDCQVSCRQQSFKEHLLFTHRGLSGPAMLQISSYWHPGESLNINCLPDIDLHDRLMTAHQNKLNISIKQILQNHLTKKQIAQWIDDSVGNQKISSLSHATLKTTVQQLQHWTIKPSGTEGYRTAEVTLGGVDCNAISSQSFEAKQVPGLYFIGEVLDVTGWLGGYNFQWAWASGAACGRAI